MKYIYIFLSFFFINFANADGLQVPSNITPYTSAGTWTPTDASGAALAFTQDGTNACNTTNHICGSYTQIGNMVFAYGVIFYPTNASGTTALIGGLPITVPNQEYARQCSVTTSNVTAGLLMLPIANSTQISPRTINSNNLTNVNLTAANVHFICIYPAS